MEQAYDIRPNDRNAEMSVLGCMILSRDGVEQAIDALKPDSFYYPANKEIFDAMAAIYAAGNPVDLVTLDAELSRRNTLEVIGGIEYIIQVSQYVPTLANIRAYIDIVQNKYILRQLIDIGRQVEGAAREGEQAGSEILAGLEKTVYAMGISAENGRQLEHIGQVLPDAFAHMERLDDLKGKIDGVASGFADLDAMTAGFHPGELIIIGARPSMGKTSFVTNIVENVSVWGGKTCALFALEMTKESMCERLMCSTARAKFHNMRFGRLDVDEWTRLSRAAGGVGSAGIYLDDTSGVTVSQILSRCRKLMSKVKVDLVIVDYLQLVGGEGKSESRQVEVSKITKALKAVAMELKVPVIICAQLSRVVMSPGGNRPVLSDLRESGSIEQDADVVMFLHREEYYDANTDKKNIGEIIIRKQRNGAVGTVKVYWSGETMRFSNLAK